MPLRRRRASAREEPEESESEPEPQTQRRRLSDPEVDQSYGDEAETNGTNSDQEQMVKNLVRLALTCEYTRAPLRRADISAKVLGTHTRQFKAVFAQAQEQLRQVFGMEMTELPVKEKITLQQKRAAAKSQAARSQTQRGGGSKSQAPTQSQPAQPPSTSWILTTTLPLGMRASDILSPPNAPTSEAESQYTALCSFIVSIIVLNGGMVSDNKLERYLTRANIDDFTPFTNSVAFNALDKRDKLLRKMERDGFIVRVRDTSGGDEVIEFVVGPRGKVEVGRAGVEGLVKTVYGTVDDPEDLNARLKRSLVGIDEPLVS